MNDYEIIRKYVGGRGSDCSEAFRAAQRIRSEIAAERGAGKAPMGSLDWEKVHAFAAEKMRCHLLYQ